MQSPGDHTLEAQQAGQESLWDTAAVATIDELLTQLTDPAEPIVAQHSPEWAQVLDLLRGDEATVDDCVSALSALVRPLRVEALEYSCPTSQLILTAVAKHPVPACSDALVAIARSLPPSARGRTLRALFRIANYSQHEPSVVAGLELLSEWADSLDLTTVGGVFFFLRGKHLYPELVVPAIAAIRTEDEQLRREIEGLRQRCQVAGSIDADTHFPTLYSRDYLVEVVKNKPDDLVYILVDGVMNRSTAGASTYETVLALPEFLRHFYTAWLLEAEVMNGGLEQYFWNPSGKFAVEAAEALQTLGLIDLAEIFKAAIVAQMDAEPEWRPLRNDGSLEAFSASYSLDILGDIGVRFDRIYDTAPISPALHEYLRAHLDDIVAFFNET